MNVIISWLKGMKFHLSKLEKENIIAMGGMAVEYHNIFLYGYLASLAAIPASTFPAVSK